MQIGDPKKTIFLGVVAVAALAFCFKQVFGGGGGEMKSLRQAAGTQDGASAQSQPGGTLAMLQLDQLRVDPFSHPKLAPKTPGNQQQNPGINTMGGSTSGSAPGSQSGTSLPGPFNPGKTIDNIPGHDWPTPLNPDTSGQKPDQGSVKVEKIVTRVALKAIFKVNQRIAYISVDGQEARSFRSGDLIKDDIQVAFVNDDSVIVKSGTKTVTLKVGQQGDL